MNGISPVWIIWPMDVYYPILMWSWIIGYPQSLRFLRSLRSLRCVDWVPPGRGRGQEERSSRLQRWAMITHAGDPAAPAAGLTRSTLVLWIKMNDFEVSFWETSIYQIWFIVQSREMVEIQRGLGGRSCTSTGEDESSGAVSGAVPRVWADQNISELSALQHQDRDDLRWLTGRKRATFAVPLQADSWSIPYLFEKAACSVSGQTTALFRIELPIW